MQENVADRTIGGYLESLAGTDAMPGGGSAAGVVGAIAAATAEMMASLTKEPLDEVLKAKAKLAELRERALTCAREDEESYGGYLQALQLPKDTEEAKATRKATLAESLERSARIPLSLAVVAVEIVDSLEPVILFGNKTVLGDAESAIVLAQATIAVCEINIRANLKFIRNEDLASDLTESIEAASEMIVQLAQERNAQIAERRINSIAS